MRLSVYSYNYAPEPTGIAVYNTSLCRWFVRRGWQVTMHTGVPWYPWWKIPASHQGPPRDEQLDGVEVQRVAQHVPAVPNARGRILLDATWLMATAWRSLRAKVRPSVIMVIAPPFLAGILGVWLRWRWRVPVVYHIQDLQVDAALDLGLLPRSLSRILLGIERRILQHVDLISVISPAMQRRVAAKLDTPHPVALLPNWVEAKSLQFSGTNAYRAELGLTERDVLIAYSGSIGAKQGLDVLLHAFAQVTVQTHLHLLIAGEGSGRAALESLARELNIPRIHFLSLAPVHRLGEFLAAADIHAVVQRREAADLVLPSKLLNIMAVGRPVVVTADTATDLARAVRAADAGLVVPPSDPTALARALLQLAQDQVQRQRQGVSAQAFAGRCLDIDAVLGRFERQVCKLILAYRIAT